MSFATSDAQQRKMRGQSCIVCWQAPCDPAHLIPRSLASDAQGDPIRVVPMCRRCHTAYDLGKLDLLPYLDAWRDELAEAVRLLGLIGALERITNARWMPV